MAMSVLVSNFQTMTHRSNCFAIVIAEPNLFVATTHKIISNINSRRFAPNAKQGFESNIAIIAKCKL